MSIAVALVLAHVACGKKGPPLEPLRLVPNQPTDIAGRRLGPTVELRFMLPTQNATSTGRIDLDHVEIYAVTMAPGAVVPPNRELMTEKYLVKTIPVRPLPEEGVEPVKDERPLPGEQVTFTEQLTVAELTPSIVPKPLTGKRDVTATPVAAVPLEPAVPMRIYVARGFSRKGHPGAPSVRVSLPLLEPPPAPADLTTEVTETALVISWTPPLPQIDPLANAAARHAATAAAALASPAALPKTPARAAARPAAAAAASAPMGIETAPLPFKALPGAALPIAPPVPFTFNIYLHADGKPADRPLNPAPLPTAKFTRTDVPWDQEQCFVVRSVRVYGNLTIESEPTAPKCVTPHDTFPPAAPVGLRGVSAPGTMSLSWSANTEADLAGYLVLRGEAPGDKLQALTPAPITETNYTDKTVTRGVRYVYVIVAVDKATPPNMSVQSARYEEIAR